MESKAYLFAVVLFAALAPPAAFAQTGSNGVAGAQPASRLIARFEQATGATIVVAAGVDVSRAIVASGDPAASRRQFLDGLADGLGAQWHKTWMVSPVSAAHPLPSAAYLRGVIESSGAVSFDASGMSAQDAIRTVAKADRANVFFAGAVPAGTVSVSVSGMQVSDAIALIAQRTRTSWSLLYRIVPGPMLAGASEERVTPSRASVRPQQERLASPVYAHFQYPSTGPDPDVLAAIANENLTPPNLGLITGGGAPAVTILGGYNDQPVIISSLGTVTLTPPQGALSSALGAPSTNGVPSKSTTTSTTTTVTTGP
ncbi:MAG: hypothetical protein P4L33_14010 [Capsulimonadaceae bacterium]|nr:hypothetical protein [Capsulimonadaceae bacterium]